MNTYLSKKLAFLSGLSMIMVVFLHGYNPVVKSLTETVSFGRDYSLCCQYFFSQGITRVAVPLFYLFSGYLFFLKTTGTRTEFTTKFTTRLRTLVVPFLFWSFWGLFFYFILQSVPQARDFFTNKLIKDYSLSELAYTFFIDPITYQLWFVRDLFVLVVLSPIIWVLVKRAQYVTLPLLVIAWCMDFNFIIVSPEALLFFTLGALFSLNEPILLLQNASKNAAIYMVIWLGLTATKTLLYYLNYDEPTVVTLLLKSSIVAGILALWSVYDALFKEGKRAIPAYIDRILPFSFFIYAFHEPTLTIVRKVCFFIIGKETFVALVVYFVAPVLTIGISVFTGFYLKQWTPKFYKVITGGR
jgi:surface polysaccharide O-acyltransferase-like enzyme